MGEEQKKPKDLEQGSDEDRREFLTKALAAAGAVAASGVVAGMLGGDAEAQTVSPRVIRQTQPLSPGATELVREAPLRYTRQENGHTFAVGGPEMTNILIREGLLPANLSGRASAMKLALEWS